MHSDSKVSELRKRVSFKLDDSTRIEPEVALSNRAQERMAPEPSLARVRARRSRMLKRKSSEEESRCSSWVVFAWLSLTLVLVCVAVLIFTSLTVMYEYSTPDALRDFLQKCRTNTTLCARRPTLNYDAVSQLLVVDSELARQLTPSSIQPISFLGKTLASISVASFKDNGVTQGYQVDLTLLAVRGNGGYLGAWIVEQHVTSQHLLQQNVNLGHQPRILKSVEVDSGCTNGASFIEISQDRSVDVCIKEWAQGEAEAVQERRFFLQDHESQFYAGGSGEDLYVDSIQKAHLRLVSRLAVSIQTSLPSLQELLDTSYRLPYAIALDGVRARSGPSATFSNLTKEWSVTAA